MREIASLVALSAGFAMPSEIIGPHHQSRPDLIYKHTEKPLTKRQRRRLRGKQKGQ